MVLLPLNSELVEGKRVLAALVPVSWADVEEWVLVLLWEQWLFMGQVSGKWSFIVALAIF